MKHQLWDCSGVGRISILAALLIAPGFTLNAAAGRGEITGVVSIVDMQQHATPLEGIQLQLTAAAQPAQPLSNVSDSDGRYHFSELEEGTYRLEINVEGFKPFSSNITVRGGESQTQAVTLELAAVATSVDVREQISKVAEHAADADTTITQRQLDAMPIPEQRVRDALPLVPGVVRTTDGTLYLKGEAEQQGMLLVDSGQMVDPVTGTFAVAIPTSAVDTLNVFETPYNAAYGGFSGGLTTIETRVPPSEWQYALNDFIPGMRAKNGHVAGVSSETPRAYVGGPLFSDRVTFSEAFDYIYQKKTVRGQPWPNDQTETRGYTSFSTVHAILSSRHLLTGSILAFDRRRQFDNIDALIPQSASANSGSKGAYVTLNDSYQFSPGMLSTMFRYTRFDSNAYPQGDADLLVTPDGWKGNYFNTWSRTANQIELMPSFQFSRKQWHGTHDLKVGSDLVRRSYTGDSQSRPVQLLREDGTVAEQIDFQGRGALDGNATEISEFAQDHWMPSDRLALDTGFRVSTQSNGRTAAFAPRVAMAYSLDRTQKTVLRAGAGLFYDRVPLLATTFTQNPVRVVSLYDTGGRIIGSPTVFQNVYMDLDGRISYAGSPGTSPRNVTWNISLDREITSRVSARVGYLQSQTSDLYLVNPAVTSAGAAFLGLEHNGNSHYREFQTSVHFRAGERSEINLSYLRTSSRGELNTISNTYIPFEEPVIRASANAPLESDIPNRVIASGIFQLPWRMAISPVMDAHNGYRYSNVDVLQDYVGAPNSERLPLYLSLDVKVYKDFRLPAFTGRLSNHSMRVGMYAMNLTNHLNPTNVLNSEVSPNFGHVVGFHHRVLGFVIDYVK